MDIRVAARRPERAGHDGSPRQWLSHKAPPPARLNDWPKFANSRGCQIDWTPFFRAWELAEPPAILDDPLVGESARSVSPDAQAMLDRIVADVGCRCAARSPSGAAGAEGDDLLVLAGNNWTRVPMLRQQVKKREGRANMCLADFIDPEGEDWLGGFAVGIHRIEIRTLRASRPTNKHIPDILLKALADRLAEAFAEGAPCPRKRVGLCRARASHQSGTDPQHYAGIRPAPAIRPVPITARSCSTCSAGRRRT